MFVKWPNQHEDLVAARLQDLDGVAERVPLERRGRLDPRHICQADVFLRPRASIVTDAVIRWRQSAGKLAQRVGRRMLQCPGRDAAALEIRLLQVIRPAAEGHRAVDRPAETLRRFRLVTGNARDELGDQVRVVEGEFLGFLQIVPRRAKPQRIAEQNDFLALDAPAIILDQTGQCRWMRAVQAEVGEAFAAGASIEFVRQRVPAVHILSPDHGVADQKHVIVLGRQSGVPIIKPVIVGQRVRHAVVRLEGEGLAAFPQPGHQMIIASANTPTANHCPPVSRMAFDEKTTSCSSVSARWG